MKQRMSKFTAGISLAALCVAGVVLTGCESNEALGRSQLILFDERSLEQSALAGWQEQLRTAKVSRDPALNARLQTVGGRIVKAAGMGGSAWEYVLFENDQPNAFVIPGNKVGVNTGLFKVVKNDDQLAAVIGHETAHVIGRHAAERASQQAATQVGLEIATRTTEGRVQQAVANYGGMGAALGLLLPYSRKHESEADKIGVDLMVKAGYRASESVTLWENMSAQKTSAPPQFLSTHPSDKTRINDLKAYIAAKGYK
ncbi:MULTISPECIES: M48 family metallopeptidase [Asticcacaulis]|uniref:M48 family metallopeptidase n=1 Tax=Asticcacaulis TaxID=76890 RepID=UPI001FDA5BD6|nr:MULTISPECIES: M48 family metallopeptidase [Asticcacaulis]MBP2160694.1 putative Zn-dependent protease [Asticcacaulis solisilvae]MDR6801739.1 putative Zn-dependent protease [Asticcacaulis sp. BE141]